MTKHHLALAALPFLLYATQPAAANVGAAVDAALKDEVAWQIVEGLTTEVGPRLAGSDAEAKARTWGAARLKALGFKNVRIDTFQIDGWERGVEQAEIVAPFPQKLTLAALGSSGATPAKGLVADVVAFNGMDELKAAPDSVVKGKIVFLSHRMGATQDGSSYGAFGPIRFQGPSLAASKGAAAVVIRSLGTDHHRGPHTGTTRWADGQKPIPAAALSVPDAEQLERVLARGKPVSLKLTLTPRFLGKRTSGNVIAEIPGRDPNAGVIVVGGHLDSWDLGTGAIDDAAGVAIMAASALAASKDSPPLRTIRVVWFGSEETGGGGDLDYIRRYGKEKHVLAGESDFGADRVWSFDTRVAQPDAPVFRELANTLLKLGVARGGNNADGGADIEDLGKAGVPIISLRQDGTRYFELHHTPDDTLDKVDPAQLRQNVAAWTAVLAIASNAPDWPEKGIIEESTPQK